jgi:hypothetical protein
MSRRLSQPSAARGDPCRRIEKHYRIGASRRVVANRHFAELRRVKWLTQMLVRRGETLSADFGAAPTSHKNLGFAMNSPKKHSKPRRADPDISAQPEIFNAPQK